MRLAFVLVTTTAATFFLLASGNASSTAVAAADSEQAPHSTMGLREQIDAANAFHGQKRFLRSHKMLKLENDDDTDSLDEADNDHEDASGKTLRHQALDNLP
ncbi:unnamed protein product [Phytophthora lilii]|uniref:RxLR effector protein n=1 Tax=Phytophthora lilii TaxID=2077276 RepID=A0A9W6WYZ4_9STRA|nr:unnamed protein product [Phytophthora lilii]